MADKTKKVSAEAYQHFLKHGHFPNEPKPSKYGNQKVEWGGETFDSKWEWERWMLLMQMEAAREITKLKRQVEFVLQPAFRTYSGEHVRPIKYVADFTYEEPRVIDGVACMALVIEDAKGFETDVFKLKWKMVKWLCHSGQEGRGKAIRFHLSRKGGKVK